MSKRRESAIRRQYSWMVSILQYRKCKRTECILQFKTSNSIYAIFRNWLISTIFASWNGYTGIDNKRSVSGGRHHIIVMMGVSISTIHSSILNRILTCSGKYIVSERAYPLDRTIPFSLQIAPTIVLWNAFTIPSRFYDDQDIVPQGCHLVYKPQE